MSIATLDRPTTDTASPVDRLPAAPLRAVGRPSATATTAAPPTASAPRLRAVPEGTEARGFVLYVGLDEQTALEQGTDLATLVEALKRTLEQLVPEAQTHAAVALAPRGAGGRDIDVVRLALQDPSAIAKRRDQRALERETDEAPQSGVVIDVSRKRVVLEDQVLPLTYTEYELLQFLVLREGRTVERAELIAGVWSGTDEEQPNERTVDVHVRRLRAKLGVYEDIVRTVRGAGYRFDRHADVSIRFASTPSPDLF